MKKIRSIVLHLLDALLPPFVFIAAWVFKHIRRVGIGQVTPLQKHAMVKAGVFPIRNHYYEPQFDYRNIKKPFSEERFLPGIDWNVAEQIKMLDALSFAHELADLPQKKSGELRL